MKNIKINGVEIGEGCPPYIVAELSANHNGSLENAKKIIYKAKHCGANAVKMQTYTADTITLKSNSTDFMITSGPWKGQSLYDLYKSAETPFEWHKPLFDYAREIGITCFSSPFDESAVDLLEDLNAPAYKIASFEAIDIPLIRYVAATKKPMIISTGMASLEEIQEAVHCARESGCDDLILLHCISAYPAPIKDSNLRTIPDLKNRFDMHIGLSDHTLGTSVAVASVALGSVFIEKHFALSRKEEGPDSAFSLEPDELSTLCRDTKDAWLALGSAGYERKSSEISNSQFRRSLYFVTSLSKGDSIEEKHIRSVRPGYGLSPKYFDDIIGKKVVEDVAYATPVTWKNISK